MLLDQLPKVPRSSTPNTAAPGPGLNPATCSAAQASAASWSAWRPPLIVQLILSSLIAHIAMNGARITTTLYALSLQASQLAVGTLVAVFGLFPVLCAVPMGRLIDRVGITRPMLGGCLAMGVGCVLPTLTSGLPWLYLSSMLVGTGFVTIQIASQHTVGVMSTMHNRSTNFSWLALGYSISSFFADR
ncbi:MFS transporter [Undibacterium arcticum]